MPSEKFFDPSEEPEAVCGNCDSWTEDLNVQHHCTNDRSPNHTRLTEQANGCVKFFPDPRRWPEADHD